MVKTLKYEHPNKSRRKTARIKQSGGVGNSNQLQHLFFLKKFNFDDKVINILEKIPNQSFQEINDSIVQLMNERPNFTTEQLCALLYIFIYKIDDSFLSDYPFPRIKPRPLLIAEYRKMIDNIRMSSDKKNIMDILWYIINLFKDPNSTNEPEESNENEDFISDSTLRGVNSETESQVNKGYYGNEDDDNEED